MGGGSVPVGVDSTDNKFNLPELTGGENEHTLTIKEMPSHNHSFSLNTHTDPGFPFLAGYRGHNTAITTGYQTNHTGESKPHNNMQKYITCYIFKRIE